MALKAKSFESSLFPLCLTPLFLVIVAIARRVKISSNTHRIKFHPPPRSRTFHSVRFNFQFSFSFLWTTRINSTAGRPSIHLGGFSNIWREKGGGKLQYILAYIMRSYPCPRRAYSSAPDEKIIFAAEGDDGVRDGRSLCFRKCLVLDREWGGLLKWVKLEKGDMRNLTV